jgi:glucose/arabinose dehydrogenase
VRRRFALGVLASVAALLAGCGGGSGDSSPTPASTEAAATSTSATVDSSSAPAGRVGSGTGGVELTELGNFDLPLYVTQPPGENDDLYVVEQGGTIERLAPDGGTSTFLDISDQISSGGERGLLSMAFSPDFQRNHLFYVDYTDTEGNTRVVEYAAPGGEVDPASRREVLRVDQPFPNHNGGLLLFGPDGDLYIGLGDGGSGGDPQRNGQDLSTLLGKILRIDPAPDGDRPYTVPADNPFVGQAGARGEIFSYGLRNPWRFSFDPKTRDLSIGDVGQDTLEEVDVVTFDEASGANFGWSAFEGDQRFNDDQAGSGAIPPVLVASHADGNCSITGGLTVRDPRLPTLNGRYIYGDLCLGQLLSFTPRPERPATDDVALGPKVEGLDSFGTDNAGRVYATSISGSLFRLDPSP